MAARSLIHLALLASAAAADVGAILRDSMQIVDNEVKFDARALDKSFPNSKRAPLHERVSAGVVQDNLASPGILLDLAFNERVHSKPQQELQAWIFESFAAAVFGFRNRLAPRVHKAARGAPERERRGTRAPARGGGRRYWPVGRRTGRVGGGLRRAAGDGGRHELDSCTMPSGTGWCRRMRSCSALRAAGRIFWSRVTHTMDGHVGIIPSRPTT